MSTFSTPYLEVCDPTLERNLQRAEQYVRAHGLKLRPHTKTHKNLDLARRQLALHGGGLTVAKVSEAEVMAELGAELLLAYPVVAPDKAARLAMVARRVPVLVAIDSECAARVLSDAAQRAGVTIGILVDLDVGMHRTGVPDAAAATELGRAVDALPGLVLRGLFTYPGHVIAPADRQRPQLDAVAAVMDEAVTHFAKAGLSTSIVSGGSTPTLERSHQINHLTEIRPGTYVFNDMNTAAGGFCRTEDCALTIVATVVSVAVRGQIVVDAGSKVLTSDRLVGHTDGGHGHLLGYPAARLTTLSEEHGQVDVTGCADVPALGQVVRIIPNHVCPCVNLRDTIALRDAAGNLRPLPIHARGKAS